MKLEFHHFLAIMFAATVVGLGTWSAYYNKTLFPVAPAPSASSSPPPLSTPSVLIKVDPPNEDSKIRYRDALIERCHAGSGIPVVGYDWRVVCVKPSAADWWDDPQFVKEKP